MPFSHLPSFLATAFSALAHWLHKRSAARLPQLLVGILFASGRRTVTSWFRSAGITDDFRPAYATVCAVGRNSAHLAVTTLQAVRPLLDSGRLLVALDDTPTPRYGPWVEGAGIHHNPSPGPAGEKYVYGHVWVTLAALAWHPDWGTIALPLQAQLYVRQADRERVPPERRPPFQTKLQLAAGQLRWLRSWVANHFQERWAVVDGGYAKRPFLRAARRQGFTVVSRLRARTLPSTRCPCRSLLGSGAGAGRVSTERSGCRWPSVPGTSGAGSRSNVCSTTRWSPRRSRRSWPPGIRRKGRSGW